MHLHTLLFSIFTICGISSVKASYGDSVGCFQDRNAANKKLIQMTSSRAADTVDNCLKACLEQYFRYAHLREAKSCFCSSDFEDTDPSECKQVCKGNNTQVCGGPSARSVYHTGQLVPGPPSSVQILNWTDTSALVKWSPPLAPNGDISEYIVTATAIESASTNFQAIPREWVCPPENTKIHLSPLHPGTTFNLSVYAMSGDGSGIPKTIQFSTQIGDPDIPDVPSIIRQEKDKIIIKLIPAENSKGPVSAYQIIVVDESVPAPFQASLLKSWSEAQQEGLPYYIAAELSSQVLPSEFVVGDGETYGGYYNPPLSPDAHVHIGIGVISNKDGVSKASYALASHEQHGVVILHIAEDSGHENSALVVGLSIAIGIFGFLLFLSIILYIALRHRVHVRRRRLPETQELSLQGPMIEVESNGLVHCGYLPEENDERPDHYEQLKHQVWNIPRNFLDIQPHILGSGKFGEVRRGSVQLHGLPIPAAVHLIEDTHLAAQDKKTMLKDLDILIKAGKHDNIISLIGTCENPEVLYVVVEHHPASLKDALLESRQLEHSPLQQRFCSLSEEHIFRMALGVAQGMHYLSSKKIVHKQLSAVNVLLADGLTAKVGGYGIADMQRVHEKAQDYTRWTAQEIFRSRHFVIKSDVWSFGCLLWEIAALGGTPYCEVLTRELPARVMRGLLLPQLPYVSDELYQLMLQCWQVDLDERPTFEEIAQAIEELLEFPTMHLNFGVYVGFHYQQYLSDAEKQS